LRDERGFRVFENKVLRRIFGTKREELTGEGRKLHTEELNDLYSSPNIFGVITSRRLKYDWTEG
jgi:PAS domain-containing protein